MKNWIFTRDTRLESGEHQIDGYDIEGFPVRRIKVAPQDSSLLPTQMVPR
jgi:hypothetical protein